MVGADLSAADEARVIATAERIVAIAERAANVAADVEADPGVQRGSRDVGRGLVTRALNEARILLGATRDLVQTCRTNDRSGAGRRETTISNCRPRGFRYGSNSDRRAAARVLSEHVPSKTPTASAAFISTMLRRHETRRTCRDIPDKRYYWMDFSMLMLAKI
jgi:hypothetical protein